MEPGSALNAARSDGGCLIDKSSVQIWGAQQPQSQQAQGGGHHRSSVNNGVIVFSNKVAFHKACYERLQS